MAHDDPPARIRVSAALPDGRTVTLRDRVADDQTPDDRSEWDDWGDDLLDQDGQPPHYRAVIECDGVIVGTMSWSPQVYGGSRGSRAWMIGIALTAGARGQGIGSLAQRMLARELFMLTDAHRVEASTDVENIAEQRALERAGFTREGIVRQAQYRGDGAHHDLVIYGVLRGELP